MQFQADNKAELPDVILKGELLHHIFMLPVDEFFHLIIRDIHPSPQAEMFSRGAYIQPSHQQWRHCFP
jgi:hypothetical protein